MAVYNSEFTGAEIDARLTAVGSEFVASNAYPIGSLTLKDGVLYQKTSGNTTESWNASHWTQVSLTDVGGVDATLTVEGIPADAKATGDNIGELKSALVQIESANPEVQLDLVSGNIVSTGAISNTNTRIRTNQSKAPLVASGDFYLCDPAYEIRVAIYNSTTIQSSNFVAFVNSWQSGMVLIPQTYVGKRAAVVIRKVGHTDDDISGDVSSIASYVKYYSPAQILASLATLDADKLGTTSVRLRADDDLDDYNTDNGVYYYTSTSIPKNTPFDVSGTVIVLRPTNALVSYVIQAVVISNNAAWRYYTTNHGFYDWNYVNTKANTINLAGPNVIKSTSKIAVTYNDDGTVTLTTTERASYIYMTLLSQEEIEANVIYQLMMDVVSCESTDENGDPVEPNIAMRFVGDYSGPGHLADGLLTAHKPGEYAAGIYTTGYEKYLRLYITTSSANATVTLKNIMVAKYDFPLAFVPYGLTAEDIQSRAIADGERSALTSWSKSNIQAHIRQFVTVKYTPLAVLPSQFGDFPAGNEIMGVPYSSARGNDRLIGMHISLYTFLSAINNPRSVLYTRYLTYNNAKTYYGCVCSTFVNYVLSEKINLTTEELWGWDKLKQIPFTSLDIGDVLLTQGHVNMVYDVTRDSFGRIKNITIAEAGEPVVKWTASRTWAGFISAAQNYTPFRYGDVDNVTYTQQPMVRGFLDEVPETVVYPDIMSEYGDKVAIAEGEDVVINVIDATGYNTIQVYVDDVLTQTITTLADFTLSNIAPGSYEIKMIGNDKETSTKFIVVDMDCSYNTTSHILTFASDNATPYAVLTFTDYPTNHYVPLTSEQLESGSVDLSNHIGGVDKYGRTYQYVKVNFMTEYGVATWYSHDLHQWAYTT